MAAQEHLSYTLTRLCMLCALLIGISLSLLQIGIDGVRESKRIDARMQSSLAIVRDSAAEAVYNIDDALADRILAGLSSIDGVIEAGIELPNRVLSQTQVGVPASPFRGLTDLIFEPTRVYELALNAADDSRVIGSLRVVLDTSIAGQDFLNRSLFVVVSGLVRAIVLAAVLMGIFYFVLTKPLGQLAASLARVDPDAPERARLPVPQRHQHDELGRWVRAVNALLASIRKNLEARSKAEDQASFLSQFDPMTGLPNRALFHDRVSQSLSHASRSGAQVVVAFCDVSAFQRLNDEYGFAQGDRVLIELASRLKRNVAQGQLARISGDRFAVMFESADPPAVLLEQVETLRALCQEPIAVAGATVVLDLRLGVAIYPSDATSADLLVQNAETALSIAKQVAHRGIQFYEAGAGEEIRARHRLRAELDKALSGGQFELHYQPQFCIATGQLTGVEALLRWPAALEDNVSTEELVRLAEESGQILELGRWVLRRACEDAASSGLWARDELRVAVNLSVLQLDDPELDNLIRQLLLDFGIGPRRLELEITETAMMADVDRVARRLDEIRGLGVQIAVDDFGTGHSSLRYLKSLPINSLKIDRAFVRDVCSDAGDAQIVAAILGLGANLKLRTVAEGVESAAQLAFLQRQGCDEAQGFYLAQPMRAEQLASYLTDHADVIARIRATIE